MLDVNKKKVEKWRKVFEDHLGILYFIHQAVDTFLLLNYIL